MSNLIPPNDHWDELVPDATPPAPAEQPEPAMFERPQSASAGVQMQKSRSFNPRLLVLPIIGVIALFGWISNRGTTIADDLKPGDCFVMPVDDGEFDRLDTEECSAPHDAQIVSVANIPSAATYPDIGDPYWEAVFNSCLEAGVNVRVGLLPEDFELNFFSQTEEGWDAGERESLCYVYSPSGLDGSMLLGS